MTAKGEYVGHLYSFITSNRHAIGQHVFMLLHSVPCTLTMVAAIVPATHLSSWMSLGYDITLHYKVPTIFVMGLQRVKVHINYPLVNKCR